MSELFTDKEVERASHYTKHRFLHSGGIEANYYNSRTLKPDGVAAIAYALGRTTPFQTSAGLDFDKQVEILGNIPRDREPKCVLSVGCGRGDVEAAMTLLGLYVIGIDFSLEAIMLSIETANNWAEGSLADFRHMGFGHIDGLNQDLIVRPDTVIFCESIEHIPEDEFEIGWPVVLKWKPLLIVTNFIHFHPIKRDNTNWDHVRTVDDKFYDYLQSFGKLIYRHNSHLVVQL